MRPGVRADGMAGRGHLPQNFGMIGGVLADREEHRLGAFIGERLEHGGRIGRPRAVVECQHDFLVGQEVELLEMLEAEARSAGGVDFHHAADAQRIRIGAGGFPGCGVDRGGLFRDRAGDLNVVAGGGGFGRAWRAGSGGALRGADGLARRSPRGEDVQNHTPAITTAATTLANIRPDRISHGYSSSNTHDKIWSQVIYGK